MLKNVALTGVALVLIGVQRLAFNAAALRLFGEQVSGSLNVALSLAVLVSLPASTAFGTTALRYLSQARGQGRPRAVAHTFRLLLKWSLGVSLATAVALWTLREPVARAEHLTERLVLVAAVMATAYVLYLYMRNVFYGLDRVATYTRLELVGALGFFLALGLLAVLAKASLLLLSFVAAYVCFSLPALWACRDLFGVEAPKQEERPAWRDLFGYSAWALVGTVASLMVRELVVLLAPDQADLGAAAFMALSLSMLSPLQILPRTLRTALFAHSAELSGRGQADVALKTSVGEANHWLLLLTLPAAGLVAILAQPLIELLGSSASPERLLAFWLLAGATVVDVVATPAVNALSGAGDVRLPAVAALVALLAAGLVWLLVPPGVLALAGGLFASSLVKGGIPLVAAHRRFGASLTRTAWRTQALGGLAGIALALVWVTGRPLWIAPAFAAAAVFVLLPSLRELVSLAQSWRSGAPPPA